MDGKKNEEFWVGSFNVYQFSYISCVCIAFQDDIVTLARSEIKKIENARRRMEDQNSNIQNDIIKIFKVG